MITSFTWILSPVARRMAQAFVILGLACDAVAAPFRVVGVSDGDTLTVIDEQNREMKCRLFGIDAPEKHQAFGARSKESLSNLTYQRVADIEIAGLDRYGRSICKVFVDGIDVNREQVARGLAWMYRRYTSDASYAAAEYAAKSARRGLWSDLDPVAPWAFRKRRN